MKKILLVPLLFPGMLFKSTSEAYAQWVRTKIMKMVKRTNSLLLSTIFYSSVLAAQNFWHFGGETPRGVCIQELEYKRVLQVQLRLEPRLEAARTAVLFQDPMYGGTNSSGKTVTNYVDLDPTSELRDYYCGTVTYNGHNGVDIEILDFYQMDEGVPVLCAAPGTVTYVHDGEFDRNTQWINGAVANAVTVTHSDGSQALYFHFRKGSIRVQPNQSVNSGDTLGFVGSSGYSTGPHLHFEVRLNNFVRDPYQGPCQPNASLWQNQIAYVLSLPFELMDHGLTTIPLSWAMILERPPTKTHVVAGRRIYSWIRARNLLSSDLLTWKFYANNSLWNQYSWSPSRTYSSSGWYVSWDLPTASSLYGNWRVEIYRNGSLIAQQPFSYHATANQLPVIRDTTLTVQTSTKLEGELRGTDPDGSIFWYSVASGPKNGNFELFGGRKRKFRYTPNPNFTGRDTVWVYAIDDENASGPQARVVFLVGTPSVVDAILDNRPAYYQLSQNYPNPFNSSTTISFSLPSKSFVSLKVFDALGREVAVLVSEELAAGTYARAWSAEGLPSGVYFYRMQAGSFNETKKLILVR